MKHGQTAILKENTSLSRDEAEEFLNILEDIKDISKMSEDDILNEFWNNWSVHDNYQEAWKDELTYNDEQTEEEFKKHAFVLSTRRCLVRDYK